MADAKTKVESADLAVLLAIADRGPHAFSKPGEAKVLRRIHDHLSAAAPQPAASDVPHDVVALADEKMGAWLAAAMDDENVCAEMKADITAWFAAREPEGSNRQWPAFVYDSEATPAPSTSTEGFLATLTDDQLAAALAGDFDDSGVICGSTEEVLRAENARLREAAQAVLDAETVNVHVGYDGAAGGGNFVYADAIRTDDEAFAKLRSALSR